MVGKIQRPHDPLNGDPDWKVEWLAVNGESGVIAAPQRMRVINTLTQLKKTRNVWTVDLDCLRAFVDMVEDIYEHGESRAARK
jgi:hypothetical protein